jgi:hypothetical protein
VDPIGHKLLKFVMLLASFGTVLRASTIGFSYFFPLSGVPNDVIASGEFTVSPGPNGGYRIVGISGTRTEDGVTQEISGLIAPNGFGDDDDLVSLNSHYLDVDGFSFTLAGGGGGGDDGLGDVRVYYVSRLGAFTESGGQVGDGQFHVAPTPEPMPPVGLVVAMLAWQNYWRAVRGKRKIR